MNVVITSYNDAWNTTHALWPSLTAGGVGPSGLTNTAPQTYSRFPIQCAFHANIFWITIVITPAVAALLGLSVTAGWLSPPRAPRLFTALCVLFVVFCIGNYFAQWPSVQSAFGFDPLILFGIFELPIKYYIMLLDSRVRPPP